jgi:radical SAM superfamily enzyme YgiQ (UPF0313 family)
MEILLVNPPIPFVVNKNVVFKRDVQVNLGLCYIASNLNRWGYKVGIIDSFASSLKEDEIVKFVKKINPRVVGISTSLLGLRELYSFVNNLKSFYKGEIILGGFAVSTIPELVKLLNLQYAIYGEGDQSMVELANYLIYQNGNPDNISGLIWLENGQINVNNYQPPENLDILPNPSYENFLTYINKDIILLCSSRGCPFNCKFCTRPFRKKAVYRSSKKVFEDVKLIKENYNPSYIIFTDETFTAERKRIFEICSLIEEEKLKIRWGCLSRIDCLDKEMIEKMAMCGLKLIFLGIEVGDENYRFSLGKHFSNKECIEYVKLLKAREVNTISFYIIGLPDEKLENIKKTIDFIKELDTDDIEVSIYVPLPRSQIYKRLENEDMISNLNWINFMLGKEEYPVYRHKYLDISELRKIEIKIRRKFYLSRKIFNKVFFFNRLKILFLILKESFREEILNPLIYLIANRLKNYLRKNEGV